MRLVYVASVRIPTEKAHGIQTMKVCEAFAANGVDVELVIPRRANRIKQDPFEYYGVDKTFKIRKLPCLDLIFLDKYIGHLALWIANASFNLFSFPYILFKKPDIVFTIEKLSLPVVLINKNLVFEAHVFPRNYFLYAPFFKRLKKIITITQNIKNLFAKKGIDANKILVAPDAVDLEKFDIKDSQEECRRKLNLPLNKKVVLYTGHLFAWKGVDTLADASRYLPDEVEIYFVGGTDKDIKRFRSKYSKANNIKIIGHRLHSEIPYWQKAADILVLPNTAKEDISKYWTSPMKMFEYMASGRPIVASDLPSLGEIFRDFSRNPKEGNTVLVEPDNPEALALGIGKLLQDYQLAAKISSKAFQDVQQHTWGKRAEEILDFIK